MAIVLAQRRWFLLLTTAVLTTTLVMLLNRPKYAQTSPPPIATVPVYRQISVKLSKGSAVDSNWRGLTQNETKNLSVLGRIMYLGEEAPKTHKTDKTYQILVWKYGRTIESRHMKHFTDHYIDPFEGCSVRNCNVTYEDAAAKTADIVIFHLHRMKSTDELPKDRNRDQIWAFLTDESPHHTFLSGNKLPSYNGLFNWSMTYRMDSDIPVPYGRTLPRKTPFTDDLVFTKRKNVLVAIMGSNCGGSNHRWQYVKELQNHIQVDVYGHCGPLKCPGHFRADCNAIDDYMFYLAFENSNCDEYVTEKLWWNAYAKNAIPVVMGASYKKVLPPDSYLNVEDYAHPKDLATHLLYLNSTGRYVEYYGWKRDYEVLNEHGYFQSRSYHYCRVCEALNYNEKKEKVYGDLKAFWSVDRDCHPAWDAYK